MSYPRRNAATQRFTLGAPRTFSVSRDGQRILFCRSAAGDDPVNRLWVIDLPESEPRLLVDPIALLGSGDPGLEAAFAAATSNPNVAVKIGYDEALSHRMMAGADAILVPSRFEPCGLTQLYGLRYGTIPLVALTGGLADTVVSASPAALAIGVANGLQFHPVTSIALGSALARLCDLYADRPTWDQMQKNAMRQPVGWGPSARAYAALYRDTVKTAK